MSKVHYAADRSIAIAICGTHKLAFAATHADVTCGRCLASLARLEKPAEDLRLETAIRSHVERVYGLAGCNKSETARLLGVDRTTVYDMLARYGLHAGGRK